MVLLNRNHLLLADKAVPATEALGVAGAVGVVLRHVPTHDACGVLGDVQTGLEPVLKLHPGGVLGADGPPRLTVLFPQRSDGLNIGHVTGHEKYLWSTRIPGLAA